MAILPSASESVFGGCGCDLHIVIERIIDMQAAVAPRDVEPLRFECRAHARLVPVWDGVADVVDDGLGSWLCAGTTARNIAGIARDKERTPFTGLRSEHQVGPFAVIPRGLALHVENRRVPIARLGVVRARIGEVVDADDLKPALSLGLRGIARAINRRGERYGFAELATIDPTAIQALDQIGDDAFHVSPPYPAPLRRRSASRLPACSFVRKRGRAASFAAPRSA